MQKAELVALAEELKSSGFTFKYEKNRFSSFKIDGSDSLFQATDSKDKSDDFSQCILHIEDPKYDGLTGWNDWLRSYGFSLPWRVPVRKLENNPNFNVKIPIVIQDSFDNCSSNKTSRYSYATLKFARDLKNIGFNNVQLEKLPATKKQSSSCSQHSTFNPDMSFFNDALQEDEEIFTAQKARNGMVIIPGILLAASFMMGGR